MWTRRGSRSTVLPGAGEFVEGHAALLERGDHGRDLVEIAGVFFEGGVELFAGEGGDRFFLEVLPSASWESVTTPSFMVPAYSLSSAMRRSWILVALPMTSMSRPVASGSRVPQWPTFLK